MRDFLNKGIKHAVYTMSENISTFLTLSLTLSFIKCIFCH